MTSLLVLVVLVLVSVAIWQLTKIFDLTQIGGNADNSQVANDNDNNVNGYLMFAFLVFIYLTTIFCVVQYGHFPLMSNSASEHGVEVDRLMWISMILIFFVQTITQALLHYFSFKYRGKKGNSALYFADNNKLEMIWSIIPAITLAGLILYGLYAWTNIMFVDEETENPMVVEIYAKQFGWEVRYAGEDNVLGKANVRYIEGVNTLGVDLADPNAQDDIQSNELHLPKGKKVVFMADLLPSVGHIPLPYVMGYDTRPLLTLDEKEKFLNEAADNNYYLFLEHDAHHEIITVEKTEKGVRLKEIFTFEEIF
mgnify:CR=1 FL=1